MPTRLRPIPIGPPVHSETSSNDSQCPSPSSAATSIVDDWSERPDSAIAYDKPSSLKDKQISNRDLEQVWTWNKNLPAEDHRLVQQLIGQHVETSPNSQALESWDGSLTYGELDAFSTSVAGALQQHSIGPGIYVPLLFQKSMWTAVALLGVIKAGGAAILLGTNQPADRLRQICKQVDAKLLLSSPETAGLAKDIACSVVVLNLALVEDMQHTTRFQQPTTLKPEDPVVVTFTSGSTGVPKGAIMTHANICSQFRHHQSILDYSPTMRLYDFAAHAFDVAYI
jgi:non-ribosomal peptide synthetase component F